MVNFIFPFRQKPNIDYRNGGRGFGAGRNGGTRKHAGCDLIAPKGTEILAMADGQVIQSPYYFFSGTYALEVKHDNGMVVRYCEISQIFPRGIKSGARVSRGQVIAYVGRLDSGSSMLHLEMYQGTKSGELTQTGNIYKRRSDLVDPTPYLDNAPLIDQIEPPGIQASRKMAETDLARVKESADRFCTAAAKFGVPAAVLAAIASRESRCGSPNILHNGWDNSHNAFGIMQVDKNYHSVEGLPDPISLEHILQATGIFADCLEQVEKKHPDWEATYILKGAAVAYNAGVGTVQTKTGMDIGSTGDDYGSDVMARAQYYANHAQLSMFRTGS